MIEGIFLAILSIDTGLAVYFAVQVARATRRNRPSKHLPKPSDLPSISVCIPARNEKHAMVRCLEHVLASDYEKMEIVVFDDSSADDTSIIVRSFAHAGVRFVPGSQLPEGWLGKNHALDILAQEASGSYVIFMDVDTLVEPMTLTRLMSNITSANMSMVSVIPQRADVWRPSVLFGPLRYFWQLTLGAPLAAGSFWAIKRDTLLGLGGLAPHKNEVHAESHIAALVGDGYKCLVDSGRLGITYEKKWSSQMETSRRVLYPLAPGWRAVPAVLALALLNVPTFVLLTDGLEGWSYRAVFPAVVVGIFMLLHGAYSRLVWRRNWWLGALLWPYLILQEFGLFLWSMLGYARHTVKWKGRSVTAPVVQVNRIEIDK